MIAMGIDLIWKAISGNPLGQIISNTVGAHPTLILAGIFILIGLYLKQEKRDNWNWVAPFLIGFVGVIALCKYLESRRSKS